MPEQPIKIAATQPEPPTRRWAVLALLGVAQLMVVLDVTIVNVALPSAQRTLGFSTDSRQWVVTAYALAFGSLLLLGGKLGDLFGRKWTFVAGLIGFAGASALGGLAQSFGMLVAARALQGAFGALLAPSALALLAATFAGSPDRPKAFGIFGAIAGAGGSFGLVLGGALTQAVSWRWCLYVNLVIAIPTAIFALRLLKNVRLGQTRHLDLPGLLTGAVGVFALVYGVSNAETHSWTATVTIVALAASVVLLTGFVLIERRVSEPLLPLGIPADRSRGGAFIALLLAFGGLFSVFLFLTFYLQRSLDYTPLLTGVAILPLTAVTILSATVAQIRLVPRTGVKPLVTLGMALATIGMYSFTRLGVHSAYASHILPGLIVTGLGLGLIVPPSLSAATLGVQQSQVGVAAALANTSQQIGGSIGAALLSTIFASAARDYLSSHHGTSQLAATATVHGYATAFWWATGIFALGLVLTLVIVPTRRVTTHDQQTPHTTPTTADLGSV